MKTKIIDRIVARIRARGRGWVFTPKDFVDLGSRAAVDQTLSRLSKGQNTTIAIRKLTRGLYDFPRIHPQLGQLSPDPDAIASAVAQKTGSKLLVAPSQAANLLGVSTQVPAKPVYLTDGRSKTIRVGSQVVRLKHAAPSRMILADSPSGVVIQALRALPRGTADANTVRQIAGTLSPERRQQLSRVSHAVPDWTRPLIRRISSNE